MVIHSPLIFYSIVSLFHLSILIRGTRVPPPSLYFFPSDHFFSLILILPLLLPPSPYPHQTQFYLHLHLSFNFHLHLHHRFHLHFHFHSPPSPSPSRPPPSSRLPTPSRPPPPSPSPPPFPHIPFHLPEAGRSCVLWRQRGAGHTGVAGAPRHLCLAAIRLPHEARRNRETIESFVFVEM